MPLSNYSTFRLPLWRAPLWSMLAITITATLLAAGSVQAQPPSYTFSDDNSEHYFPTTTGRYHIIDVLPEIPTDASGVYSITYEVLATGYWPQQEGFAFGLAGYPLAQTTFHELGQFTDEFAFRGRDGRSYAEGVALPFGSVLKDIGDRIRVVYDADAKELSFYTQRVGASEFALEGGRVAFENVVPTDDRQFKFAVAGICWQPCGIGIVAGERPPMAEGALGSADAVVEPVALPVTANSAETAVSLLDFSLSDGADDFSDLLITSLSLDVSGTLDPSRLQLRLNGPDASNVVGSWDHASGKLTFADLDIAVQHGTPHVYTVSAWLSDITGLSNGQSLLLSLATDGIGLASGSSLMIPSAAITNGSGSLITGVNTAPDASAVTISGTFREGQTLTGSYTYSDADNDAESGTDLIWQRASSADGTGLETINGATGDTLVLSADDVGRYVRFGVTPGDGITQGATAYSDWTGPVLALNQAPARTFGFSSGSNEHYFPTTTGRYHIIDVLPEIPTDASGVYSVTFEVLATGHWPGQEGFTFGMAGYPLAETFTHELGQYTDEFAFRGRDGASYAEGVALHFGSPFRNVGDRIRVVYDADAKALSFYTQRGGASEFSLEGGRVAFQNVVPKDGRILRFAVAGVCWQACGIRITGSERPPVVEGALGSADAVVEPVALPVTANSADAAVSLLDFSLSDGADDFSDLLITSLSLDVSGTLDPSRLQFRLNGPDASNVAGSWDNISGTLTFADLDIAVQHGTPHVYTVSAWLSDITGLNNGQSLLLSLSTDGIGLASGSSLMIASAAISNGSGSLITGVNTPPEASAVTIIGTPLEGQTLTGSYTYSDADNDEESGTDLIWQHATNTDGTGLETIDGATGNTLVLSADDVGRYVRFGVTPGDGITQGATAYSDWEGPVLALNQAPINSGAIGNQNATQGIAFSLDVSGYFSDPDGDALIFTATGLPAGFSITEAGIISGTASNSVAMAGPYTVVVTATDPSEESISADFQLTVINVNDAPVLDEAITAQQATQDVLFTIDISGYFSDPDGDTLSFTASGLPAGFSISTAGVITGIASNAVALTSPYAVIVTATDPSEESISADFQLTVINVNDAPVLDEAITAQQATQDVLFTLDISGYFSDPDGDALIFSATGLPAGFSITEAGIISGTASNAVAMAGPYTVVVTATDPSEESMSTDFELTVINVDDAPTVVIEGSHANRTLEDGTVIAPNGILDGGRINGQIDNQGIIRGTITAAPGSQINGGMIEAIIQGSENAPVVIANATIVSGATLSHAIIAGDTILQPGVLLGPNVLFQSPDIIPSGFLLTNALPSLGWQDGDARPVPWLDHSMLTETENPNALSILKSIQAMPNFEPVGNVIDQNPDNGTLQALLGDVIATVLPVQVVWTTSSQEEGLSFNDDGDLVIISNRALVIAFPSLTDNQQFQQTLETLGMQLSFDERANLIVRPQDPDPLEPSMQQLLADVADFHYAARPDILALPAHRSQVPGIHEYTIADGMSALSYIYFNSNGVLMEQDLAPAPADWSAFKQTLLTLPDAENLRINAQGLIEFRQGGEIVKARMDYRVEQGHSCPETNHELVCFAEYRDINGDGTGDYRLVYANGDSQWLLIYP